MWTQFGLHHVHQLCTIQDWFFCPAQRINFFGPLQILLFSRKSQPVEVLPGISLNQNPKKLPPSPPTPPRGLPFLPNIWMSSVQNQDKWAKARRSNPKSAHIVTTGAEGAGKDVLPQKLLRRSVFIWTLTFSSEFKNSFLYLDCADNSLSTRHQHMCNLRTTPHARDFHITGMLLRS